MKSKLSSNGILLLIFAQVMVGINIVVSKVLISSIPVLVLLEIRFLLATLILLPLHWLTPAKEHSVIWHFSKLKMKEWAFIFAQAISAGVIFNCLMLTGLNYTDANVAGIITSALPAVIAIMSWLTLGEKISKQKIFCILFATLGLLVIAFGKFREIATVHSFLGDTLIFLSLLPEASYYVLCRLYKNQLPIFLASALLNGINAIILFPILFLSQTEYWHISNNTGLLLLLVGFTTGLFYIFWFLGAPKVDGVMASLSTAVMPVSTVLLAWLLLSEDLSLLEFTGMTLVLFSIAFYAKRA